MGPDGAAHHRKCDLKMPRAVRSSTRYATTRQASRRDETTCARGRGSRPQGCQGAFAVGPSNQGARDHMWWHVGTRACATRRGAQRRARSTEQNTAAEEEQSSMQAKLLSQMGNSPTLTGRHLAERPEKQPTPTPPRNPTQRQDQSIRQRCALAKDPSL